MNKLLNEAFNLIDEKYALDKRKDSYNMANKIVIEVFGNGCEKSLRKCIETTRRRINTIKGK